MKLARRLGWALAGALALAGIATLARVIQAGPLDPPGPVGSTMKTLADLVPAWHQTLTSSGCGSQRWTCVMGGQAVLDNETGLVWQKTPIYPSGSSPLPWADARSSCESTPVGLRLGWRLPTSVELESLLDAGSGDLAAGHPFTGASPGQYWTSTTGDGDSARAETIWFGGLFGGGHGPTLKTLGSAAGAWCVRGQGGFDPAPPQDVSSWWRWALPANDGFDTCHSSRFECTMSGEAVIDHLTGLVWQRNLSLFASAHTQGDASTTCLGATFAGMHGWRLPTAAELLTLQDSAQVPAFPLGHPFLNDPGIVGDTFWTSSAVPGTANGYAVYFHSLSLPHSGVSESAPGNLWMAWCVRGPE